MARETPKILRMRLNKPGMFGSCAEIYEHLDHKMNIDSKPVRFYFDTDERFVRVESVRTIDLIPVTNIASMSIAPRETAISASALSAAMENK